MARVAPRTVVGVWSARSEVPWFDAHIPMLAEVCGFDPEMMDLSFSQKEQIRDWFLAAALSPEIGILETTAILSRDFSTAYLSALPWGQPFFGLDADTRDAALTGVGERLAAYTLEDGEMTMPFRAFLVTAIVD